MLKKKANRLVSLFLCVVMVLGIMPVSIASAQTTTAFDLYQSGEQSYIGQNYGISNYAVKDRETTIENVKGIFFKVKFDDFASPYLEFRAIYNKNDLTGDTLGSHSAGLTKTLVDMQGNVTTGVPTPGFEGYVFLPATAPSTNGDLDTSAVEKFAIIMDQYGCEWGGVNYSVSAAGFYSISDATDLDAFASLAMDINAMTTDTQVDFDLYKEGEQSYTGQNYGISNYAVKNRPTTIENVKGIFFKMKFNDFSSSYLEFRAIYNKDDLMGDTIGSHSAGLIKTLVDTQGNVTTGVPAPGFEGYVFLPATAPETNGNFDTSAVEKFAIIMDQYGCEWGDVSYSIEAAGFYSISDAQDLSAYKKLVYNIENRPQAAVTDFDIYESKVVTFNGHDYWVADHAVKSRETTIDNVKGMFFKMQFPQFDADYLEFRAIYTGTDYTGQVFGSHSAGQLKTFVDMQGNVTQGVATSGFEGYVFIPASTPAENTDLDTSTVEKFAIIMDQYGTSWDGVNGVKILSSGFYSISDATDLAAYATLAQNIEEATPPPFDPNRNLALGAGFMLIDKQGYEVEYSSSPIYATDGDVNTQTGAGPMIMNYDAIITLGEQTIADKLVLTFIDNPLGVPNSFNVWVCENETGNAWTQVATFDDTTLEPKDPRVINFSPRKVRRVKIEDLSGAWTKCMVFSEAELYWSGAEISVQKNTLLDAQTTVKIDVADANGVGGLLDVIDPYNAIDNNPSTTTRPNYDTKWLLELDLGRVHRNINGVEVSFASSEGTPAKLKVMLSEDGQMWRTARIVNNPELKSIILFPDLSARYVRIVDASADSKTMVIASVDVFNTPEASSEDPVITDIYPLPNSQFAPQDTEVTVFFNTPITNIQGVINNFYYAESNSRYPTSYVFDSTGTKLTINLDWALRENYQYVFTFRHELMGIGNATEYGTVSNYNFRVEPSKNGVGENIALGKEISYDMDAKDERPATLANDGDYFTVAMSQPNSAITVDLGEVVEGINAVNLMFGTPHKSSGYIPSQVEILTSIDGDVWESVATTATTEINKEISFNPRRAQFVKVVGQGNMGLGELEIYRTDIPSSAPLKIDSVYPTNNMTGFAVDESIIVSFNKAYPDTTALDGITITEKETGNNVEFTYSFDASDSKATLTPVNNLAEGTQYVISFDEQLLGIENTVKDVLFVTYAPGGADLTPFAVKKVTPADKSQGFAIDGNIVIEFTQPLDDIAVANEAISLTDKLGNEVSATISFVIGTDNKSITIKPDSVLAYESEYTLSIDGDALGIEDITTGFTTAFPQSQRQDQIGANTQALLLSPNVQGAFTSSSVLPDSVGRVAQNAIDDSLDTFACAANSYQWQLHLDLGSVIEDVDEVRVRFADPQKDGYDGRPASFDVIGSKDGVTYTVLKTVSFASVYAKASYVKVDFAPTDLRYIRIKDNMSMQNDEQGQLMQMAIGDVEVYKVSPDDPYEFNVAPINSSKNVALNSRVVFESNKPLGQFDVTFTDGQNEIVNRVQASENTAVVIPLEMLRQSTQYTVTIASTAGDYEHSTTFTTTADICDFEITTTSSAVYMEDRDNAIYPAFVDNFKYQAWTMDGSTDYFQLKTSGAVGDVTWSITSGALPDGLQMSQDGKIYGKATKEGTFSFSVKATDELGNQASKTLSMLAKPFKSKWHEDAKFGVMIQWGAFSAPNITTKEDLYKMEQRTVNFDADEWAQKIADMGGRVFNFTVMGGDSIRLWPSQFDSALDLHTERNYVGELIEACHERGIKFIGYIPGQLGWLSNPDSGVDGTPNMLQFEALQELVDMGMDGMWVDLGGALNLEPWFNWKQIASMIKYKNPDFIMTVNPCGTENGWAVEYDYIDFITTEGHYRPGNMPVASWSRTTKRMSSEMTGLLQSEWGDTGSNSLTHILGADEIIQNIRDNWANGVTYLAAIVAQTDGTFTTPAADAQLPKVAEWVNNNIDDPALFGYNKNVKEVWNVDQNREKYTGFVSQGGEIVQSIANGTPDGFDHFMGMEFIAPNHETYVTSLGRYVVDGNDQIHRIRLIKESGPLEILREVELDLSTATVDSDGFAYVPIEPVKLEPNAVYYILSAEDTTDTYAKPQMDNLKGTYNTILTVPAWTDISATRISTPINTYGHYLAPYLRENPYAEGGGLVNFKAIIGDGEVAANLSANSHADIQTTWGAPTGVSAYNSDILPSKAVDGDDQSHTLAGDDNWAYAVKVDFGVLKKGINEINIKYASGLYATQFRVEYSQDGKNFEPLVYGANNTDMATVKFDPVDARAIRIVNIIPQGANDIQTPGFAVATAEIIVKSQNAAYGASAQFVNDSGEGSYSEFSDATYPMYALDSNPQTTAKAKNANTALKLKFDAYKEISAIRTNSPNDVEYYVSDNADEWEYIGANELVLDQAVGARYLLVKNTDKSAPIEITDIEITAKTALVDPGEDEVPQQPPVGGGGGGASSGDSSSASDSSTSRHSASTVAPTLKPGWVKE